jgi:hypothetical protein
MVNVVFCSSATEKERPLPILFRSRRNKIEDHPSIKAKQA